MENTVGKIEAEPTDLESHGKTGNGRHSIPDFAEPVRKKRSLQDKVCRVCGDKALAHNFDVITCESCKAFFRRNALKHEEPMECAFQRSCPINVQTRRFCAACRLKKCLEIGMRTDMIHDERKRPMRGDQLHRKRKQQCLEFNDSSGDSQSSPEDNYKSFASCKRQDGHDSLEHSVDNNNALHRPKDAIHPIQHQDLLQGISRDFEPIPAHQLPSDLHMYWRLTDEERALLTQISATYQNTILRLPKKGGASEHTERSFNSITLEDLLGRCDVCANNVVKLMKGLVDYRQLQVEDQLATLKACAMRTLILKGAACFVVERDAWIKAYGELPVSLFVRVTGHEKLIRQHAEFCRSLKTFFRNDITLYALLQCVMLFDPRGPNIADRQVVNTFRDKYLLLLKHYLESQVSYAYSESYMDYIREKLAELKILAEKMTLMFKEWTALIQPLMIEVLSLA